MSVRHRFALGAILAVLGLASDADAERLVGPRARYGFLPEGVETRRLDEVILAPAGFTRVPVTKRSFAAYLRGMPLRATPAPVRAHDGRTIVEPSDRRVAAVAALDVGRADLQQCADSVIRWHAEWLWAEGRALEAAYHFVSGDRASFAAYGAGDRPVVSPRRVLWERRAAPATDRKAYRAFLDLVFTYASTLSLVRETKRVERADVAPGDFFVLGGSPGHAVLVLDVAVDARGRRVALLGQGYMPAQDFHVLSADDARSGHWFSLEDDEVVTPFWRSPFPWSSLRRFGP
jgi:hypothetical protein